MKEFNERAFLVRALVAIFAAQIAMVGYENLSCRNNLRQSPSDSYSAFCLKISDNFSETGKSAANVFLALLVPAAALGMAAKGSSGKVNNEDGSIDSGPNTDVKNNIDTEGKG
jgi:hypothetical protein